MPPWTALLSQGRLLALVLGRRLEFGISPLGKFFTPQVSF